MTTHPDLLLALSRELPELPEPLGPWHDNDDHTGHFTYTADQMRAYGQQCASSRPANAREGGDGETIVGWIQPGAEFMPADHRDDVTSMLNNGWRPVACVPPSATFQLPDDPDTPPAPGSDGGL